jgi:hypothetical protein
MRDVRETEAKLAGVERQLREVRNKMWLLQRQHGWPPFEDERERALSNLETEKRELWEAMSQLHSCLADLKPNFEAEIEHRLQLEQ